LVLVGSGEVAYERELGQLAEELGVQNRVHFLGQRWDVPSLLSSFDGLVLATRNTGRREAFGAVLVEAMAAGLPVIATRSGGPEEIVVPGLTGWLVEPESSEALALAVLEFARDADRREKYGRAGRKRAANHFTAELMVSRYESLYRELMV